MELLKYPDPRLTEHNRPIDALSSEDLLKVEEMFGVMARSDGLGLAAPQVGWNVRLFILGFEAREPLIFWNPKIELVGEKQLMTEGCLSFPGISVPVSRALRVRLLAETPNGPVDLMTAGLAAQAVQHEMDHVDGKLFIEHLSPEDRARIEPVLAELRAKKN